MTAEVHDDSTCHGARVAPAALVDRLTKLPQIATAQLTREFTSLQFHGTLHDGRRYHFRARWGQASLSIAAAGENPAALSALTTRTPCSFGLTTESGDEAISVLGTLLEQHHL